jgi:hypothetical protein
LKTCHNTRFYRISKDLAGIVFCIGTVVEDPVIDCSEPVTPLVVTVVPGTFGDG